MAPNSDSNTATLSTKVPGDLAERLDQIALFRGTTRSGLLRQLVEAAVEHRVLFAIPAANPMSVRELAASDVGRAALARTRLDVAAACSDRRAAPDVGAAPPDPLPLATAMINDIRRGHGERRLGSEKS